MIPLFPLSVFVYVVDILGDKVNKSKTIHVDFGGTKKVTSVDEMESVKVDPQTKRWEEWISDQQNTLLNPKGKNLFGDIGMDESANNSSLIVDPAAYFETVIMKFEHYLDSRGCFDDNAYSITGVHIDGLRTFQVLQREIPELINTMEVLRSIIQNKTGVDPGTPQGNTGTSGS